MNKSYKVVFSRVRGGMVVASEAASCPRKKTVKTVIAAAAAALAMGSVMAQEAPTVPDTVWANKTISEDLTVDKGQSFTVDSATMTGGTLTVNGAVNRALDGTNYDGLFTMTGGTIAVGESGNFEVRDFKMSGDSKITAAGSEGNNTVNDPHGRTAPAFGSYNSFVMDGGEITLENGGRIWIGSAKKDNPESYERMQLNKGTINLAGEGFITGNKRCIAKVDYYDGSVKVDSNTLAYNVIGLDGVNVSVTGTGNVIDAAGTELTAGTLDIAQDAALNIRATTSTNQADSKELAQMLKDQSYVSVSGTGVLDVDGRLEVNVKELRLQDGGTINMNTGSWAGWVYSSSADAGKGSLVVSGGKLNINGLAGMDMYDVTINGGEINVIGPEDADAGAGPGNSVRTSPSLGGYNSFTMTGGTVNLDNNGRLWAGSAYDGYHDMVFSGGTINMIGTNGDSYITGTVTENDGGNKLLFNGTTVNVLTDGRIDGYDIEIAGSTFNVNKDAELLFSATYSTHEEKHGQSYEAAPLTLSSGAINNNQGVIISDLAMTVSGGTLTTDKLVLGAPAEGGATEADNGTFFAKNGITISGGTVTVGTINTSDSTSIKLTGGTLQTASTQAFTLAEGQTLFAETVDGVNATADTALNTTFTATSGVLALTDEGVYTEDSLAAMSGALAGGTVSLHILNAELALEEGKTTIGLYKNVVTDQVGATETVDSVTDGKATITAANNGAQSLQVLASDEKTDVTTVELKANAATNFTLVGSQEGVNLVTTADNTPVNLTVGGNVTLKVGADVGTAATAGTFADVTLENGAAMHVANIAAQAGTLTVGSTAAAGTDSDSTDDEAAETETVAETAEPSGATLTVGSSNSRGSLSVESLSIKAGSTVFLDPAWSGDAAVDTAANASHLSVGSIADLSGNLIVGQNSLVAVGATADAAVAGFNAMAAANTGLNWGKDGVTAALYIAKPISFGTTGKIVVDGSFDSLTAAETAMQEYQEDYANNVTVASNGLLAVDQAALGADTAIAGSLYLENNSRVGLVNATEGVVNLATTVTVDSAATNGIEVVTDNPFITAGAIDAANGTVTTSLDAANGLGALASTGLQAMTRRADSVLASTIADRTSIDQELNAGINLWVDVRGENYQSDNFDNGGEFDADMGYGTFGGDVAFGAFTAGAAFQYGTGSLRSSVSSIKNSIDNYAFSLYGTYKVTDAFKLAAELAYVWGENDISSSQAALNQSVDTEMYSFGLRAMYELKAGNFSFVPSIGLRVSQLSTDAFQVGSVKVEDQDQTLVQVPIALRINASEFDASGWSVAPSFKIAYVPTFGDKDIEVLNHPQDVIDTAPVQADFGLRIGKDNMMFNVNMLLGAGEYGTSAIGGKVGFKYAF